MTAGRDDQLIERLQALIRLRTVNTPGKEIIAADYLAGLLFEAGLAPETLEPFPGTRQRRGADPGATGVPDARSCC